MAARAGIVVTGTEVLTGRVADRNGPWLSEQLRQHGVDVAQVIVVGDRPDDMSAALGFLVDAQVDVVITTGGLGPTADDMTARLVGDAQRRPSELDEDLERHIADIVTGLNAARGWRLDPDATAAAIRKQAMVPVGATVLPPVGTAPGLVVPSPEGEHGPPIIVLPGPPPELQEMWPAVLADPLVRQALADRSELRQRTLRLWATPESELAKVLRENAQHFDGLEITTCLREGELEIVARYDPSAHAAYEALARVLAVEFGGALFSPDGRSVDEMVADTLRARGHTVATAESCTAGLLAGRLTELPGSSDYMLGGLVTYSNAAKRDLAGVDEMLIDDVGAVSAEVAAAMATGARQRLGAHVGVGVTGVAGPGGGTADKPVGLVHLCVQGVVDGTERRLERRVVLPGSRADVRRRTVALAMHLLRELLS